MATSLISPLKTQGGTIYTFTSATNHLNNILADDTKKFVFSKFALLNLPDVETPSDYTENKLVWEGIGSKFTGDGTSTINTLSADNNVNFAESFQNYVLNHEQLILNGYNDLGRPYDNKNNLTTSERIFWKWLKNLNVIKFEPANNKISNLSNRYIENISNVNYDKVVKYIGDIDVINNITKDGYTYSEVYINVPTNHGSTPDVIFKTYQDNNYAPSMNYVSDNEYIFGRSSTSEHPNGMNLEAYFDDSSYSGSNEAGRYVNSSDFDDLTFTNIDAKISSGSTKPISIQGIDGVMIEFESQVYNNITSNVNISSISEFNTTSRAENFSFNCALIYYDSYDISEPNKFNRNLFGVLILDDYINDGNNVGSIKSFEKFKPNEITKLNGNSYGLKLNLRLSSNSKNSSIETIINEYNNISMDMFMDAIIQLQENNEMFRTYGSDIINIKREFEQVKSLIFSQPNYIEYQEKLNNLQKQLNDAQLNFNDSKSILNLIDRNNEIINDIINGKYNTNIKLDFSIFKEGDGYKLNKTQDSIFFINTAQSYRFNEISNESKHLMSIQNNGKNFESNIDSNIIYLDKFNNYFINDTYSDLIEDFEDDLIINIDNHKITDWSDGQSLKIKFNNKINLNNFKILIQTDSKNKYNQGAFGKNIGVINSSDLITNKPLFEIICINKDTLKFTLDILR